MKIDVHVHLSSPLLISSREKILQDEPGLYSLYADPQAKMVDAQDILLMMDREGVSKALVMGFSFRKEENARAYNSFLLSECRKHEGRLLPLCAFDPRAPFAEKLAQDFLEEGGYGLGELCVYEEGLLPPLLDRLESLLEICKARDAPLLVHVNEPIGHKYPGKAPIEVSQIFELAKRSKGAKLILAHFGGGLPFFASLKKEVRDILKNVRFDTAAMPFIYDPVALKAAISILGAEYFLLGTDYPLLPPSRYEKYFTQAGLSPEEKNLIFAGNAKNFLGL